jgi:acetyltransferase-like isoleucine patch superfamily enzyme
VHVSVATTTSISGPGVLHLGKRWDGLRYLPSELSLGHGARLVVEGAFSVHTGFHLSVNDGANLTLGSGYINNGVSIDCFDSIRIGHGVAISKGVTIRDSDNHAIGRKSKVSAPIRIGDRVWVGLNATILKGVTIGEGAVIAAGAVVTRDVPACSLVAGVPARVVRSEVAWT